MNIYYKLVILCCLIGSGVVAESVRLNQVTSVPVKESKLPGYEFDTDQAFKVSSGALKGKFIFFARTKVEAPSETIPRFVVSDNRKIISSIQLPNIVASWNIEQPQAVSIGESTKNDGTIRILAVLTMVPGSGRSSDYWDHPFVFDINPDGTIESNQSLNKAMTDKKPMPKTIKEIKKYLSMKK